ncbi:unnamed protein product [Protopolystoma xenopodis]|uniref:Uncharacterized protein n=1 Tax=Protopolystoma xenopodis TaxID=117903 RepID=A0A3S5ATE5_9PLAT|nr:unnamed protein product [Protopolystoma xenopodis]
MGVWTITSLSLEGVRLCRCLVYRGQGTFYLQTLTETVEKTASGAVRHVLLHLPPRNEGTRESWPRIWLPHGRGNLVDAMLVAGRRPPSRQPESSFVELRLVQSLLPVSA